jgi:hypothetical protein
MSVAERPAIDFRSVCRTLHGSRIERHALDLTTKRLELAIVRPDHDHAERVSLVFEGVTQFRWQCDSPAPYERMELPIVGLERLAAGDVWRLYLNPGPAATLELSCSRITCDGAEVQGVGRSYEDGRPARTQGATEK